VQDRKGQVYDDMSTVSKIVIDQQYAAIGIRTTPAKMHITMPSPTMRIRNELPEMQIERRPPSFEVNWQKVHDESGLKGPITLIKTIRDEVREGVLGHIADKVREYDEIGDLTRPGNRVAEQCRAASLRTAGTTINLGSMPQSLPEMSWDRGSMHVSWSRGRVVVEWEDVSNRAEIELDPPFSIEVYLRQKPFFRVTVEDVQGPQVDAAGNSVDQYVG